MVDPRGYRILDDVNDYAGEIGGVLGPLTIGWSYDWTGSFAAALDALSVICVGLALLAVWLARINRAERAG